MRLVLGWILVSQISLSLLGIALLLYCVVHKRILGAQKRLRDEMMSRGKLPSLKARWLVGSLTIGTILVATFAPMELGWIENPWIGMAYIVFILAAWHALFWWVCVFEYRRLVRNRD